MKALVVGYGSIGKRHVEVLEELSIFEEVVVVTRQCLSNRKTFKQLETVSQIEEYDYIVIASETHLHYCQLVYLNDQIRGKTILVEKPIFETFETIGALNNQTFVGYNLRFHPIITAINYKLENKKVLVAHAIFGQYLPTFRPGTDYSTSYSADPLKGGGVTLDISHEIDYMQWMFGGVLQMEAISGKISELKILSEDIAMMIGKTEKGVLLNISLDYLSKIPIRQLLIHTEDASYLADFINQSMIVNDKGKNQQYFYPEARNRNLTYRLMHQSILAGNTNNACTVDQALITLKVVDSIKDKSKVKA
ncbi:Gfo/Idh/MocA family oxidoreductase [bacterium]|nr:Gfo/Idh/MocA family oxidoreductase [bacterium]